MLQPRVSVLIDTYNHQRFIASAIDSVLAQEGVENDSIEIVIIDDGSSDGTGEIARCYEPRVRYVRKDNGGQASAFNFAVPQCAGEIIAMLDGDDWWHSQKLARVLETFDAEPDLVAVGHGIIEVHEAESGSRIVAPRSNERVSLASLEAARRFVELRCCLGTSRLTARRDSLMQLLPAPQALVYEADEYLFTLLPALGPVAVLRQPLTYYRLHSSNLYMTVRSDSEYLEGRACVDGCLANVLPPVLDHLGAKREIVQLLRQPLQLAAERSRLRLGRGHRWNVIRTEARHISWHSTQTGLPRRLARYAMLVMAVFLSPRSYYRLRDWYARNGLGAIWNWLGPADGDPLSTPIRPRCENE